MVKFILPLLGLLVAVTCHCPIDRIHGIGHCSYRIQCINTIKDIRLDRECQGSSNYDVNVDVTLFNATDTFQIKADPKFLSMITTLTVFANWPRTDLTFLENMYRLRHLNIMRSKIQEIRDSPFRNLSNLESINLSHNGISDIEELFLFESRPLKFRTLSLAHNSISEVPGDTFVELTSLTELDLSYNFITELNEEPFCNLTNLIILKLNNNRIKDLNGAMNNLLNLKKLYLRFNEIQNIDMESIKTIHHLEIFDISKNQLENLKPIMFSRHWQHFDNHSICKILLSENLITFVPNATQEIFPRFTRNPLEERINVFTELDLSKNSISHVEYNAFQSIIQLTSLDLSNNKLITFNVNAEDLTFIKYLNLSCNFLNTLSYTSFSVMHNLQNLDLSHNLMDYFPDQSLTNTYKLKYVNVTYNDITELHNLRITFHSDGGILDLSNNGLSALNIPVDEAMGLTELILNSNNITDTYLIKLIDQNDLIRLDMSKNYIQELDEESLQLPITLGYLDLSFNEIQRIGPSAFRRVSHLKTLKLSHNRLTAIEYGAFNGLTTLLNLDLSYNQIGRLDSKVFMDLKFLSVLSLRYNDMYVINHESWLSHKTDLTVYLDGNSFSCEWLAKALSDVNNGFSKMHPAVLVPWTKSHSIEGIPCEQDDQKIINPTSQVMSDERLLIITQKILEAVQEQTSYLRKYMWHSKLQEAERQEKSNSVVI